MSSEHEETLRQQLGMQKHADIRMMGPTRLPLADFLCLLMMRVTASAAAEAVGNAVGPPDAPNASV